MSARVVLILVVTAVSLSLFGAPASAQSSAPGEQKDVNWHHQILYRIMKDMTQEMGKMADEMSRPDLTAAQRKQMAHRMERMATLMRRMSGLTARPAMANPDSQKMMEEMRKEMDGMMRDPRMTPGAK